MATVKKRTASASSGTRGTGTNGVRPKVIYIHGIGKHLPPMPLKREWDLALFGREMGGQSQMAYWSDILHPEILASTRSASQGTRSTKSAQGMKSGAAETRGSKAGSAAADMIDTIALLEEAGLDPGDQDVRLLVASLLRNMGLEESEPTVGMRARGVEAKVLPLPAFLRKPIARAFLEALVKDSAAYFFRKKTRRAIQKRLLDALGGVPEPVTIVAHSQGTVVTLEVLADLGARIDRDSVQLITIGSPLGIQEVQDFLSCSLEVPPAVRRWYNFADPLDPVALDKGIANDFERRDIITDEVILNTQIRNFEGFNPHSAAGYLSHPKVRRAVYDATRIDSHARFLVARDVSELLAVQERHPVLIEMLEPHSEAVDESREDMLKREAAEEAEGAPTLARRIDRAAENIADIVRRQALGESGRGIPTQVETEAAERAVENARIERLRRFVAARLTPEEIGEVSSVHTSLRVYRIWKSAAKRKLITRSHRVIQSDAARGSYGAMGAGITWAVLDTGIRSDHPHFRTHGTIEAVWDCTQTGHPRQLTSSTDTDGHGTHVAGIIAGEGNERTAGEGSSDTQPVTGIAPLTKLHVYKVLDDAGRGEDAWIIKALDHIAEQNENSAEIRIHGINLSLGGPYDSTVYGCGFTPICTELRRLWRAGVLVVVASGNEGLIEITTPRGAIDINSTMSIGDPANLEDCIAVGSVHADRPNLYGISAFSSRGPTSDGRLKPDVVAPGERIKSCNAHFLSDHQETMYRQESGTSMAAPHVSGLLAAFLSVRREFRGRPDEVKALLLRTCTDIGRDRYHQGYGIPNLMRMLLGT